MGSKEVFNIYKHGVLIYKDLIMTEVPYRIVQDFIKDNERDLTFEEVKSTFQCIKNIISERGDTQFILEKEFIKGKDDTSNNRQKNYFNKVRPLLEYSNQNNILEFGVYTQWKNDDEKSNFRRFIKEISSIGYEVKGVSMAIKEIDENEVIDVKKVIDNVIIKLIKEQNIKYEDFGIKEDYINENWYDMAIIKNLSASSTKAKGQVSSNQSSILLSGNEFDMFPVIRRKEFSDKPVGRHITIQLPFKIMGNNLKYLLDEQLEGENKIIETLITTNEATQNRVELGTKSVDGDEYIKFYDGLYEHCKIIVIKIKNKLEYIMLVVKAEDTKEYFGEVEVNKSLMYFDYKKRITKAEQVTFINNKMLEEHSDNIQLDNSIKLKYNRIVFGAPGTGKSYKLNEDGKQFLGNCERVTFHPNYSYANFVGTYKPVKEGKDITYNYVPGPFMRILVKALDNPTTPYLLLIEEINRANVAAVFGDVFQLLDRYNGESEYEITTSEDMRVYLQNELHGDIREYDTIKIPDNMYIWATMNSADQGVFPMDTAFKRRWDFEYIDVNDKEDEIKDVKFKLGKDKHEVNWNELRNGINTLLLKVCKVNEDKLLGPYFISKSNIEVDDDGYIKDNDNFIKVFKNKVIMYLYEDAAGRQHRNKLFSSDLSNETYSTICKKFDELGEKIFSDKLSLTNNES